MTSPAQPPLPTGDAPPPVELYQSLNRVANYPYSRKEYLRRALWMLVRQSVFRYSPTRSFRWRRWLLRRFGATLTETSLVRRSAIIFHPWLLSMGEYSTLADDVVIYNLGPVSIGRHSVISQGTYVCAGTHDYTRPELPLLRPSISIGSGVWIAAQAFIGPGVTIGDNAVIGARAAVFSDIPSAVIAGGNPARVLKPRPRPASSS